MADAPEISFGEHTREGVAYKLFLKIAAAEGKEFAHDPFRDGLTSASREYILSTYAECLATVISPGRRSSTQRA